MNKIPPISPNANYFGSFNRRNSQNNQNSKDSSKDSKENKEKFDTMLELFDFLQSEEHNNDSKNTNNNATAQILIPTNPYGIGNGGNNRLDIQTQGQSTTIEKDGRGDTTAYNGGFDRICGAESRRIGGESRESRAMGEGSQGLGRGSRSLDERSEIIKEIYQRKARLTNSELNNLNTLELQTNQQAKVYLGHIVKIVYREPYKQNLLSTIENHLKYIDNNPTNTIEIIEKINILNKEFAIFQQTFPESEHNIAKIEKRLTPLKEKYLPKNTKENPYKSKSKSNDDFGMGM